MRLKFHSIEIAEHPEDRTKVILMGVHYSLENLEKCKVIWGEEVEVYVPLSEGK